MDDFECATEYYNENQGTFNTFVCPSCGEPLYFCGWENVGIDFWVCCPICGRNFFLSTTYYLSKPLVEKE